MTVTTITDAELAPKDYASDQEVRWCPGCGDYAILKAVQKALAELGARRGRFGRRGAVRRTCGGHAAGRRRDAAEARSCAQRGVVRRGVPELCRLQRRGVRQLHRENRGARCAAAPGARQATALRTQ